MRPPLAALTGALFILPMAVANAIVGSRIEPFFSLIRPSPHTSGREYALLAVVLLLIPVGAFIAARPMLLSGREGRRRFYPANAAVAVLLSVTFVMLAVGLGTDIYRCDVLGIPNCD